MKIVFCPLVKTSVVLSSFCLEASHCHFLGLISMSKHVLIEAKLFWSR